MSRTTKRSRSALRASSRAATSAAESPWPTSSTARSARSPTPIDAVPLSMTWISRPPSTSAAIRALLIVPDSVSAMSTQTIASAPSANAASNASWYSPGTGGRCRGERRVGRRHPLPEVLGREVDTGLEGIAPEGHGQRHDPDARRGSRRGRQVCGRVGHHGDLHPPALPASGSGKLATGPVAGSRSTWCSKRRSRKSGSSATPSSTIVATRSPSMPRTPPRSRPRGCR